MNITVQMTAEEYDNYRDYQLDKEHRVMECERELNHLRSEHRNLCSTIVAIKDMPSTLIIDSLKRVQEQAESWISNDDLPF